MRNRRTLIILRIVIVAATGVVPLFEGFAASVLKKIQAESRQGETRLTFVIDGPVNHSVERHGDGMILRLRKTESALDAPGARRTWSSGPLQSLRVFSDGSGTLSVSILLRGQTQIRWARREGSDVFFGTLHLDASAVAPVPVKRPSATLPPVPPASRSVTAKRLEQTTGLDLTSHVSRQVLDDASRILSRPTPDIPAGITPLAVDAPGNVHNTAYAIGTAIVTGLIGTVLLLIVTTRRKKQTGEPRKDFRRALGSAMGNSGAEQEMDLKPVPASGAEPHRSESRSPERAAARSDAAPFELARVLNYSRSEAAPDPKPRTEQSSSWAGDRARVARDLGVGKGELDLAVALRRIQETQLTERIA